MAIVINKNSRVPYEYMGKNKFRNIHTQVEGEVLEDKAKEVFVINVDLASMCMDNPNIKDLIRVMNMKVE